MKTVYFILGMHRSGTSALSGTLNRIGIRAGENLMYAEGHETNSKGFYENMNVYSHNEKILKESNSAWHDHLFDIEKLDEETLQLYVNEAKHIIKTEYLSYTNFIIKDPRICLLFPIWERACLDLNIEIKTIIPYRNPDEVAQSLSRRDQFSKEKCLVMWLRHVYQAEIYSRNYPRLFLEFDDLLTNTDDYLQKVEEFTAISITSQQREEIAEFLDKDIKHINLSFEKSSKNKPKFFQQTIKLLATKDFENQKAFDKVQNQFLRLLKLFHYQEFKQSSESLAKNNALMETWKNRVAQLTEITTLKDKHINSLRNKSLKVGHELLGKNVRISQQEIQLSDQQDSLQALETNFTDKEKQLNESQAKLEKQIQQSELLKQNLQEQIKTIQENVLAEMKNNTNAWKTKLSSEKILNEMKQNNVLHYSALLKKHAAFKADNPKKHSIAARVNPIFQQKIKKARYQQYTNRKIIEEKFNQVSMDIIEKFNAHEYLMQNTDVIKAIDNNNYESAMEHFILNGFEEILQGMRLIYANTVPYLHEQEEEATLDQFSAYLMNANDHVFEASIQSPQGVEIDLSPLLQALELAD